MRIMKKTKENDIYSKGDLVNMSKYDKFHILTKIWKLRFLQQQKKNQIT